MLRRAPLLLVVLALGIVGWLFRDLVLPGSTEPSEARESEAEESEAEPVSGGEDEDADAQGPILRAAERPRLSPEEQARREAAQRAAIEAAAKAGQVAFGGTLLDAAGRPVGGARLVVAGGAQALTLTTDADGAFAGQVKPGRYDLFVTAPGRGSVVLEGYVIDGSARLDLALQLLPPSTVTVVLSRGGLGLEGAAIDLKHATWRWQGDAPVYRQLTDGSGRATFADLATATYDLTALIPQGPTLRQPLQVTQDAEVKVVVPDGVELHGTVAEAGTNRAVGGAEVVVTTALGKGPRLECSITTQSDGTFRFLIPQGNAVALSVKATGFAPWPDPRALGRVLGSLKGLAGGKSAVGLNAVLSPGGAVAGRASQDGTDVGLPGLVLAFRPPRRGEPVRATTAEDGRYSIGHLNPGTYDVIVESPGWFPSKPLRVTLPNEQRETVVFDLVLAGARSLSGVVVHHDGTRAGGARVWLTGGGQIVRSALAAGRPLETFSSADGRWSLTDVPPEIDVVARAAWGTLEAAPVYAPAARPLVDDVRLVLAPTGALFGRITEVGGGEPVVGARVRLVPQGEPGGRDGRTVTTDAEGRWRAETLIPGGYLVTPSARDYLPSEPRAVTLAAGVKEERADLLLDPGLVISGVVTDEQGRALADAMVSAEGPTEAGPTIRRRGQSGVDGRFRLIGFPRGTYRLRAAKGGFQQRVVEGLLGGEDRLRVALVAAPAAGS